MTARVDLLGVNYVIPRLLDNLLLLLNYVLEYAMARVIGN